MINPSPQLPQLPLIQEIEPALVAAQIRVTNITPLPTAHSAELDVTVAVAVAVAVTYEFQWKNPILGRYEWAKLVTVGTDLHQTLESIYRSVRDMREELEGSDPGTYLYRWAGTGVGAQ